LAAAAVLVLRDTAAATSPVEESAQTIVWPYALPDFPILSHRDLLDTIPCGEACALTPS